MIHILQTASGEVWLIAEGTGDLKQVFDSWINEKIGQPPQLIKVGWTRKLWKLQIDDFIAHMKQFGFKPIEDFRCQTTLRIENA